MPVQKSENVYSSSEFFVGLVIISSFSISHPKQTKELWPSKIFLLCCWWLSLGLTAVNKGGSLQNWNRNLLQIPQHNIELAPLSKNSWNITLTRSQNILLLLTNFHILHFSRWQLFKIWEDHFNLVTLTTKIFQSIKDSSITKCLCKWVGSFSLIWKVKFFMTFIKGLNKN